MAGDYGPWRPLSLDALRDLLGGAPCRWWLTGGLALEQFADASWRSHGDTDVGIRRQDAPLLYRFLSTQGFHFWIAAGGVLTAWDGRELEAERSENNVWARSKADGPWVLDITIGDGADDTWIYRRDPSVRLPWSIAVRTGANGLSYLAPEIQLLFKSKGPRPKDDEDARRVIPLLDTESRAWLRRHLPEGHAWQELY